MVALLLPKSVSKNLQIWIQQNYLILGRCSTLHLFFFSLAYSTHTTDNNNANMKKAAAKLSYNIGRILASWWCHAPKCIANSIVYIQWAIYHLFWKLIIQTLNFANRYRCLGEWHEFCHLRALRHVQSFAKSLLPKNIFTD